MRHLVSAAVAAALILAVSGCDGARQPSTRPTSAPPPTAQRAFSAATLADDLRALGTPASTDTTRATAFGGLASGEAIRLQDGWVHIYTFPSASAASSVAASITPDGSGGPFGGAEYSQVEWMGVPHLFRRDRVIAIFLSEPWRSSSPTSGTGVIAALEARMGPQFAGGR